MALSDVGRPREDRAALPGRRPDRRRADPERGSGRRDRACPRGGGTADRQRAYALLYQRPSGDDSGALRARAALPRFMRGHGGRRRCRRAGLWGSPAPRCPRWGFGARRAAGRPMRRDGCGPSRWGGRARAAGRRRSPGAWTGRLCGTGSCAPTPRVSWECRTVGRRGRRGRRAGSRPRRWPRWRPGSRRDLIRPSIRSCAGDGGTRDGGCATASGSSSTSAGWAELRHRLGLARPSVRPKPPKSDPAAQTEGGNERQPARPRRPARACKGQAPRGVARR